MKTRVLPLKAFLSVFLLTFAWASHAQTWTTIATDVAGDGSSAFLLDGTQLDYRYDAQTDSVWFRVTTDNTDMSAAGDRGVNIMINIPSGGSTFNFWGTDNTNAFHKLLTVWVQGNNPTFNGTIGFADASGVSSMNYTNLSANNILIDVNDNDKTIILGMKREDLISDSEMGGNSVTLGVAGAVGSSFQWNDDIYDPNGEMTITKTAVGIARESILDSQLKIYPNPVLANAQIDYTLAQSGDVSWFLLDITGKQIMTKTVGLRASGAQSENLELDHLPAGIYSLQLQVNGQLQGQVKIQKR